MRFCPTCGLEPRFQTARFCRGCRTPLVPPSDSEAAVETLALPDLAGTDISTTRVVRAEAGGWRQERDVQSGRYRLVQRLGLGPHGELYLAEDTLLGVGVAVRLFAPLPGSAIYLRHQMLEEVTQFRSVHHPNVLVVLDLLNVQGRLGVVMELLPQGHVGSLIPDGGMPVAHALALMTGILSGISAMNSVGLFHGNLKPANVLLSADGTPKVSDPELARDYAMRSIPRVDDCDYMSPEQIRGEAIGLTSDVYSAGVLLYKMLTGRSPFCGVSGVGVAAARDDAQTDMIPQIAGCSEVILVAIQVALTKRPADRWKSAAEFSLALTDSIRLRAAHQAATDAFKRLDGAASVSWIGAVDPGITPRRVMMRTCLDEVACCAIESHDEVPRFLQAVAPRSAPRVGAFRIHIDFGRAQMNLPPPAASEQVAATARLEFSTDEAAPEILIYARSDLFVFATDAPTRLRLDNRVHIRATLAARLPPQLVDVSGPGLVEIDIYYCAERICGVAFELPIGDVGGRQAFQFERRMEAGEAKQAQRELASALRAGGFRIERLPEPIQRSYKTCVNASSPFESAGWIPIVLESFLRFHACLEAHPAASHGRETLGLLRNRFELLVGRHRHDVSLSRLRYLGRYTQAPQKLALASLVDYRNRIWGHPAPFRPRRNARLWRLPIGPSWNSCFRPLPRAKTRLT